MSIFDYTVKKHPAGFKGYRVAIAVGGDPRQKYFSTNGMDAHEKLSQYVKARELEKKWIIEKEAAAQKAKENAVPTARARASTGVRGISKRIVCSGSRHDPDIVYRNLRYVVNGSHLEEKFHHTYPVTKQGWRDAVKFLAEKKHLTKWKHLLERQSFE